MMQLKKNRLWLVLILFAVVIVSCKKEPQYLVAKTHEGRNTIGYENYWGQFVGGSLKDVDFVKFSSNKLTIYHYWKTRLPKHKEVVDLGLTLQLSVDSTNTGFKFDNAFYVSQGVNNVLNLNSPGYLDVNYSNLQQRIVAGTFELNFLEVDSELILKYDSPSSLKNGRFDVKY